MPTKTKSVKSVKTKEDPSEKKAVVNEPKFKVETTTIENPPSVEDKPATEKATQEEVSGITSFSQLDSTKSVTDIKVEKTDSNMDKSLSEPTPPPQHMEEQQPIQPAKSILDPQDDDHPFEENQTKNDQISSEEVKEWLKDVRPDTSVDVEKTRGPGLKVFLFLFVILLLIGAVAGAVFYFTSNKEKITIADNFVKATPTIEATVTPQPTKAPEVDPQEVSKLTVNILNGNGIIGDAAKAKTLLKDLKFKDVKTGNAEGKDYVNTTVSLKSSVPEGVYEKIKTLLQNDYNVTKSDGNLEDSSSTDVVIILGLRKS